VAPFPFKPDLARFVAWALCTFRKTKHNQDLGVLEWFSPEQVSDKGLAGRIEDVVRPTVFVLPKATPYSISHDLEGFTAALVDRHYAVITTEVPKARWHQGQQIDATWLEPTPALLYDQSGLRAYLQCRLETLARNHKGSLVKPEIQSSEQDNLVESLAYPERINLFIQMLERRWDPAAGAQVPAALVDELTRGALDDKEALDRWFRSSLSNRERILSIGLALLPGLYEDQFFSAMDEVIAHSWRQRDASLVFIASITLVREAHHS